MTQKQLHRPKNGFLRRTARVIKKAIVILPLAAGLMFGSPKAYADNKPEKNTLGCRTPAGVKSGKLAVGQEIWFGVTWRAMYKMKVTKLTKEKATYDLTIPFGSPIAGAGIVSYSLKFNGIEAPRSEVESLTQVLCTTGNKAVPKGKAGSGVDHDMLSKIVSGIFKKLKRRGEGVLIETSAFSGSVAPLQVEIIGSNSKEFRLRITASKGSKPVVVRLDRAITQNFEFLTESAGYFTMPLRIASISVDKKGRVKGTLKVDCSKKVYMEMFMSEHSATHPYCRPCEIKRTTKKDSGVGNMLDPDDTGTKPTKKAKSGVGVMLE